MRPSEDIKPITYMKTRSKELVEAVTKYGRSVVITQKGDAKVVVVDVARYERDQDALILLKLLSQGVQEAEAGEVTDHETLMDRIEQKLLTLHEKEKKLPD